jgi:hydroxymethylpyrimidine pyrophosphatase-like HAD family hydrolase
MNSLILDLDFTLLHLEAVPDSIEVPGRTRSAWISPATVQALHALQDRFSIVLATARSWDGTHWITEGLAARGVRVTGVVLEDGALLGTPQEFQPLENTRDWKQLRANLEHSLHASSPPFEWQHDFKACLVARAEDVAHAQILQTLFSNQVRHDPTLRTFRDGRKVYVAGITADKCTALQTLLGDGFERAAGVGDGLNDLCWLARIATPCTLSGAVPAVIEQVRNSRGLVSPHSGHAGIVDVLRQL